MLSVSEVFILTLRKASSYIGELWVNLSDMSDQSDSSDPSDPSDSSDPSDYSISIVPTYQPKHYDQ